MDKTTILVIDDHAILRAGLASVLNTKSDLAVIADAENGEVGIRKALKHKPDVIITDLMMPGMDGAETTRRLRAEMPEANILILTTFGAADGLAHALEAGARGAIMKNCDLKELATAIRTVAAGGSYISPEIQCILKANPPAEALSPRQAEILQLVVDGAANGEIATRLNISVSVVKEHIALIFHKIGAHSRSEATAIALRKQLVKTSY